MTWNGGDHPRGQEGRFAPKRHPEPGFQLEADPVEKLLKERRLEHVEANRKAAESMIASARRCASSAAVLVDSDPDSAIALAWDAVRKGISAVMAAEGVRPTKSGGHQAVLVYMEARLGDVIASPLRSTLWELRSLRNATEYSDLEPEGDFPIQAPTESASKAARDAHSALDAIANRLGRRSPDPDSSSRG